MKKITIFIPYMTGFGGTETVITNLFSEYNRYDDEKYQMSLVNIGGYEDGSWLDSVHEKKVIWLNQNKIIRKFQYVILLPWLLFRQVQKQPDLSVAISTNPVMWCLLMVIKKITKSQFKVLSWYHYSLEAKKIPKSMLKTADGHLAISTGIAQQMVSHGIEKKKVKVIFNPILKNNLVIKRTDPQQPCRFIYVGRIMLGGQKNLKTMFDALSKVKGDWVLDILGKGYNDELTKYLVSLGIEKRVNFLGFKHNAWAELKAADCLLLSSKYEGLPMVLNEAISVGIPVLSFDCPTGPADIINRHNGVLINMDDQASYTEELQRFVERKYLFTDIAQIKSSIQKFYSENYFATFIKSLED